MFPLAEIERTRDQRETLPLRVLFVSRTKGHYDVDRTNLEAGFNSAFDSSSLLDKFFSTSWLISTFSDKLNWYEASVRRIFVRRRTSSAWKCRWIETSGSRRSLATSLEVRVGELQKPLFRCNLILYYNSHSYSQSDEYTCRRLFFAT